MGKPEEKQYLVTDEQKQALKQLSLSRIIIPVLLGLIVVGYLFWKQFDPVAFSKIKWSSHTLLWLFLSLIFFIARHLFYSKRLHILAEGELSYLKCIELIFIFEFSTAVTPTTVGGAVVALFVLNKEKLSTAKTTTIVIYKVVLDTIFFISTLPIFYFIFGPQIIRPNLISISSLDGWGFVFVASYIGMAVYGSFFFYGLFINPYQAKTIINWVTALPFMKKYREKGMELAHDIAISSLHLSKQKRSFHIKAFLATAAAWYCKFFFLNCLIVAMVENTDLTLNAHVLLYARLETMFVIMAFSPSPGGAGFAEVVFGGFLSDYVPRGISIVVALVWRLISYYSYLAAGAIIIPNWLNKIRKDRSSQK